VKDLYKKLNQDEWTLVTTSGLQTVVKSPLNKQEIKMNKKAFKEKLSNISIWKNGDQRAPFKRLLLLLALAELQANTRIIDYSSVKDKLTNLLIEFGPKRKSHRPEQPFVRPSNDGIWNLQSDVAFDRRNPKNHILQKHNVSGGFTNEVYILIINQIVFSSGVMLGKYLKDLRGM
jgi:hypothetical protein